MSPRDLVVEGGGTGRQRDHGYRDNRASSGIE